jgi:hypothetical protein
MQENWVRSRAMAHNVAFKFYFAGVKEKKLLGSAIEKN